MESEFVRYSRAGDVFHYRWAARRCLKMIYPKSLLRYIVIEGSKDRKLAGEYVIDVAEYSGSDKNKSQEIAYFQLKHSTVRKEQPFNLSDLKDTIEGFAKRYSAHFCKKGEIRDPQTVTFSIVTNRQIAESFKQNIRLIGKGGTSNMRFQNTLEKYTNLEGEHLNTFCASLEFADGEGDYNTQRHKLHEEISQLLAGTVDNPQIDNIISLVQERALPNSNGKIVREDILIRFGATSERHMFPAPPEFEKISSTIPRKQYVTLLDYILNAPTPLIIHAAGGVGKTVFACHIANSLPLNSFGVVYDCFGGGGYRNRSMPRHRYRDALVQIVNELASRGLCDSLIAQSSALEDEILIQFLARIKMAAKSLKKVNKNAILAILIDAADNAEMAAEEFSQPCFVHELLREQIPDGCRLVVLCRTERIHLLQPSTSIPQLELEPFSEEETLIHFRTRFPRATNADGLEFHRLTGGNPRVQVNVLNMGYDSITKTLVSLGPAGTTVGEQIDAQLDFAISAVKENYPANYQSQIDAICIGLANLPPFIPINVLSTAAGVDKTTVKSFIVDLGRPLWLSDTSVQFRDEPTETWFRERFSATVEQKASYITRLKPLAYDNPYVAEALPSLLLQAKKYTELINLTLSNDLLPKNNLIDQRNVRVYRLKFAFKAALKLKHHADALKIALLAGEEVAGDKRLLELLSRNVDLIAPLQKEHRVQELAFRGLLSSGWDGSENVYSAALLSSVEIFRGEARSYLRAANNWLQLYFQMHKKNIDGFHQNRLEDNDILQLTSAHFNLFGASDLVDFIVSWQPPEVVCRITKQFIRQLIDAGDFDAVDEILKIDSRNQYLTIAITHELLEVGRFPSAESMKQCLTLLATKRFRIPKSSFSDDKTDASALVSFTEACVKTKLSKLKILQVLKHYFPKRFSRSISSTLYRKERDAYLRVVALRCVITCNLEPNLDELLPKELVEKQKEYRHEQDVQEFKEIVGGLIPWYVVRALILTNDVEDIVGAIENASRRSRVFLKNRLRDSDGVPYEISRICIEILTICQNAKSIHIEKFFTDYLKENQQIWIPDRLKAVRAAYRLDHLSGMRRQLEQSAFKVVASSSSEDPNTRAQWYIDIARAVFPVCRNDATIYFNHAIEAVSKFGDEIVQRWEAIAALAKCSVESGSPTHEMTYRFIRCAELVGDNVVKEKYWDRNDAIRICARLSPSSALAALSRWRDRDVGFFDQQILALADELVKSDFLSPAAGWSLSAFFAEEYGFDEFASLCIGRKPSTTICQYIFDTAIRDLRLNESKETDWQKLKQIAQKHSIQNTELDDILAFYAELTRKGVVELTKQISQSDSEDESEPVEWEEVFDNLELTTSSGISEAIRRFNATSTKYRNNKTFWKEVFKLIDESEISNFLQSLGKAESVNIYDMRDALSCMPNDWRGKISFKQNWTRILKLLGYRFAHKLTNHYLLNDFLECIQGEKDAIVCIHKGILEGLSSSSDLADPNTFFSFAEIASTFISPKQASELLDFALTRFEFYINDDYADGGWSNWLVPPDSPSRAFAGFIWAALGSPRSKIRWQAAHCVRRLAETNCQVEIDALMEWMKGGEVGAFGSHKFPFYKLHARQYLLIALARISLDYPQILKHHKDTFTRHALGPISHVLIQKFSAEIALNIENEFPNTYRKDIVDKLRRVGLSNLPIKQVHKSQVKLESFWHIKGKVDKSLKFYHGYDFDRYWFDPLGRVFGISGKQVEELATEIVVNEWNVTSDGSYKSEPRAEIWRSSWNKRETWHSHENYPHTDDFSFYLSYHAMFVVAAKLLQKMPVVYEQNLYEDEWAEWLHRHLLTRNDGRWLADRRDPAPLLQPGWIFQKTSEKWLSDITSEDFLEGIFLERYGETWMNVFGSWEENDSNREESFRVTSALVSRATSPSLLNALTTCTDPYEYKLPEYKEKEMEIDMYPFWLKGWIWREQTDNRLDKYDPLAGQIAFPPYQIGESIVKKLKLTSDSEQREWFFPNTVNPSILCELWRTNQPSEAESPLRSGSRLNASITFLKNLCMTFECELIFEVQVIRRFKRGSYWRNEDGYRQPHSKIFIFSADGKLKDAETYYQIR